MYWGNISGVLVATVVALSASACVGGPVDEDTSVAFERRAQGLGLTASQSRVLGFESPQTDWTSGAAAIGASANANEGDAALAVVPQGWTELSSIPLSTLANVRSTVSYDILVPAPLGWGETSVVLVAPSLGLWWEELGSQSLAQLPSGQYATVSFDISPSLVTLLSSQYSDLTIKVIVNAPAMGQPYLIDNLVLTDSPQGAPTGAPQGEEWDLSVRVPKGMSPEQVFISATEGVSVFSQAHAGELGTLSTIANFGSLPTYLQTEAHVYGNVSSVASVQLEPKAKVFGDVVTEGSIGLQGAGADSAAIVGTQLTLSTVESEVVDWSVVWPTVDGQDFSPGAAPTATPVTHTVLPGVYGAFDVGSRNHVFLSAGEYFFESFNTEPEAQLHLDTSDGAVIIYVRKGLPSGAQNLPVGGVRSLAPVFLDDGDARQAVLAFLGTGHVFVQGSWKGTIVAPDGDIKLERPSNPGLPGQAWGHEGAFFGRTVEIAGGLHAVHHVPFDWSNVLTPPILASSGESVGEPVGLG